MSAAPFFRERAQANPVDRRRDREAVFPRMDYEGATGPDVRAGHVEAAGSA